MGQLVGTPPTTRRVKPKYPFNVPDWPTGEPVEGWDSLSLWAATVFLEAEGEPPTGQDAVAWVIRTRCDLLKKSPHQVILAPWQFSCWNSPDRPLALKRLSGAWKSVGAQERCWQAAAGALWRLTTNPTPGASHYLNTPVTLRLRGGRLPAWAASPQNPAVADPARIVAVIGHHTFMTA